MFLSITKYKYDIVVTVILNGSGVVEELFLKFFGQPAPRHDTHVVTFCGVIDGSYRVVNYLNCWNKGDDCYGDAFYIGSGVTDKKLVKSYGFYKKQVGFAKISIMYVLDNNADKVNFFGYTSVL